LEILTMNARVNEPVEMLLESLGDEEVENYAVDEIETAPIAIIRARLLQLGLDPQPPASALNVLFATSHGDVGDDSNRASRTAALGGLDALTNYPRDPINDYISQYIRAADLAPEALRRRLRLCALMGSVPIVLTVGVAIFLYGGSVTSANSVKLSELLIGGGILTMALAIVTAIQAMLEAHVHQWLLHKAFAGAVQDLVKADPDVGRIVVSHFRSYAKLDIFLSNPR
jgi:hypothetical protein